MDRRELDGVASLRAFIGGALHGMATKYGWGAKQAAEAMGASERHADNLLTGKISDIPLECLIDMATFAGLEIKISVALPK